MIAGLLGILGLSFSSLAGGGAIGIVLEVIGLIGKGRKAVSVVKAIADPQPTRTTLVAPAGSKIDMTTPAAPATPTAKPLPATPPA